MKILCEQKSKETLEFLEKLYHQVSNPERFVLHFTNIEKIGINPQVIITKIDVSTPAGIYGYTLEDFFEVYNGDIEKLPYGKSAKYIFVLKLKPDAEILTIKGKNLTNTKIKHYWYNIYAKNKELFHKMGFDEKKENLIEFIESIFPGATHNPKKFYEFVINLVHGKMALRKIFMDAGIDAIYDKCTKTIFPSEPCQIVILSPDKYEIVKLLHNVPLFVSKVWRLSEFFKKIIEEIINNPEILQNKKSLNKLKKLLYQVISIRERKPEHIEKQVNHLIDMLGNIYKTTIEKFGFYNPLLAISVVENSKLKEFLKNFGISRDFGIHANNEHVFALIDNENFSPENFTSDEIEIFIGNIMKSIENMKNRKKVYELLRKIYEKHHDWIRKHYNEWLTRGSLSIKRFVSLMEYMNILQGNLPWFIDPANETSLKFGKWYAEKIRNHLKPDHANLAELAKLLDILETSAYYINLSILDGKYDADTDYYVDIFYENGKVGLKLKNKEEIVKIVTPEKT